MRLEKYFSILAVALAACQTMTFAFPRVVAAGISPLTAQEQLARVEFIAPDELKTKIANNEPVFIVDLRGPSLYAQADKTMKGAVHTKVRRVVHRLREVSRDIEVVTYCECPADEAAIIGARSLLANGFKRVRVLKGGWKAWLQAGGQLRPRPR